MQHKSFYWLLFISKQASMRKPETGLSSLSCPDGHCSKPVTALQHMLCLCSCRFDGQSQ